MSPTSSPFKSAGTLIDAETSGNPEVSPPSQPIERFDDSILAPHDPSADTIQLDPSSSMQHDAPGPSTTYIPRSPSPPLPNLRTEHFPPEWDDGEGDGGYSDSDDEVVATLPIYLSPTLNPHLHLFQFPLHTRSLVAPTYATERGKGITARLKEKAGKVEVEVPVDAGSDVWRDEIARDYGMTQEVSDAGVVGGYGFGGRGEEEGATKRKKKSKDDKRWGDRIRLRSEQVPSTTGYYAGVVHDG
jgi:DNA-directed RNA polymerase-3 subunit RPC5